MEYDMNRQMTTDETIAQKSALIDDLYNSRNEWRDRCLKAEAELKEVSNEIDGAKEMAETARENDEYWKRYTARLEDKILALRSDLRHATRQRGDGPDAPWRLADTPPDDDIFVHLRTTEVATWDKMQKMWRIIDDSETVTEWRPYK
jgi:hypothetical protein